MGIFRYFEREYREVKLEIKRRIEEQAEFVFEDERAQAYVECMLTACDDVEIMTNEQKEDMRIECLRRLDILRQEINNLWDEQIRRTARFQIGTNIFIVVGIIATVLAFIFGYRGSAFLLLAVTAGVFTISEIKPVYSYIMYILTATWATSDQLLLAYNDYGRKEAGLRLADYRGLSRNYFENRRWIFSTTHKIETPPE